MGSTEKRTTPAGVRWRARWRDDHGRQRCKTFHRKADAEAYLATVTVALASGDYVDARATKITFTAYYDDWSSRQVWRPGTRRAMDLAARGASFRGLALGRIQRAHVETWIKELSTTLQPSTVRTRFNNVRQVFRAAVRDRVIRHDPTVGVALPRRQSNTESMRILSSDEAAALLAACSPQFLPFVAVGLLAGLRLGEIAGLQLEDVDFLNRRLHVRRQVQRVRGGGVSVDPPKSASSYRTVPIPDALVEILSQHVGSLDGPERESFLFTTAGGVPTDQNVAGDIFRRTRARAGLRHVRFHDLRHTYASALIHGGADVVTVQRALGHASASTTLGAYAHLWPDAADRTRRIIGGFAAEVLPERGCIPGVLKDG